MKRFLADLHIHTCLSPCGSLEMGPRRIVETALAKGLQAIAVTDHNTTLQCPAVQALGEEKGLKVFAGVEVTTKEEAHCLVFFPSDAARCSFQHYLDAHLPPVANDPDYFGDQVWVNAEEEIEGEVPFLLLSALDQRVDQIAAKAKEWGCLFVAAHVERPSFSLIGQLGFIDPALPLDAVEYNQTTAMDMLVKRQPYLQRYVRYTASDAHLPEQIGTRPSVWRAPDRTFESLRKALQGKDGCSIEAAYGES